LDTATLLAVRARRRAQMRAGLQFAGVVGVVALVAASAAVTRQARTGVPLPAFAAVEVQTQETGSSLPIFPAETTVSTEEGLDAAAPDAAMSDAAVVVQAAEEPAFPVETRWFDGRPVRPARTMWMTVTAYSPDAQSCGPYAQGITSSLHSVWTNGMKLVAADSSVLPLGSIISVPGYDEARVVPVLDRGGAIKGHRLDVLYPTHERAREWGVQRLKVTVWEYADGKPAGNWRKTRDSK